MNSSTSAFRRGLNAALMLLLGVAAFLAFDRGITTLLGVAEKSFYAKGEDRLAPAMPRNYYNSLIMGTSRAYEGILPIHLHHFLKLRAFSLAGAGCYPRYNYLAYKRFREHNGPPRYLFYGLDYFTFDKYTGPRLLAAMGVKVDDLPREEPEVRGLGRISMLAQKKPRFDQMMMDMLNRLAVSLESKSNRRIPPAGISTYTGLHGKVSRDLQHEPPTWQAAPYTPFPGREGDYLEKLLELAIKDRARVFLVYLPDFINVYRTNHMQDQFREQMHHLAARFPRVHFIDFNRPDRFPLDDPEMFVDGGYGSRVSHLSALGARRLNRMLALEVQRHLGKAPGMAR